MEKPNEISKYKIIGTLVNSSSFSAWIASNTSDTNVTKMYIINRFPNNKNNLKFFKDLFSCYSSPSRPKDMVNFFTSKDSFYIIFNYTKGDCITERFDPGKVVIDYQKRCSLLKEILLKIHILENLPTYVLLCITDSNNICVDDNSGIQFIYNLERITEYIACGKDSLFKNISNIINLTLKHEINGNQYTQLKIVLEKCNNNLYSSIPELIVNLDKAEKTVSKHNIITTAKKYIENNTVKVKRYAIIGGIIIAICVSIFFIPWLLNALKANEDGTSVALGNLKYNVTSEQNSNTGILPIEIEDFSPDEPIYDYSVPSDSGLPSEDYVVQYGDTISSICASHYSSQKFITSIETFNNISDADLNAGIIIKLPNELAVSDYIIDK